jgi:hypothetical protein
MILIGFVHGDDFWIVVSLFSGAKCHITVHHFDGCLTVTGLTQKFPVEDFSASLRCGLSDTAPLTRDEGTWTCAPPSDSADRREAFRELLTPILAFDSPLPASLRPCPPSTSLGYAFPANHPGTVCTSPNFPVGGESPAMTICMVKWPPDPTGLRAPNSRCNPPVTFESVYVGQMSVRFIPP